MTEDDLKREVRDLRERIDTLEEESDRLKKLPDAVAELKGALSTLTTLVTSRFDNVDLGVQKATSLKNAIQYAAVVIVPIIVALIGGYFVLRVGK